jgi:2-phospho-L-lactate/phosphoenolpyruvate guanylyltransferase
MSSAPLTQPVPAVTAPAYGSWSIVIPVKPTAHGKSRLRDIDVDRTTLARAIALDTIEAAANASRVEAVIVVTDDSELAHAAAGLPHVTVVGEGPEKGLNAAIATGAEAAGDGPRAALLGDVPALNPVDLDAALAGAEDLERGLVADAEGTGTTLVTARSGAVWLSAFGDDSAARHRLLGCVDIDVPAESTLRRDVDTVEQLAAARALGVGPRTAAVLAAVPTA